MIIQGVINGLTGLPYDGALRVNDIDGVDLVFREVGTSNQMTTDSITVANGFVNIEVVGNPQAVIIVAEDAPMTALVVNGVWYTCNIVNEYSRNIVYGTDYTGYMAILVHPLGGSFSLVGQLQAGALSNGILGNVPPPMVPATGAVFCATVAGVFAIGTIAAITGEVKLDVAPIAGDKVKLFGTAWTINT